MSGENLAKIISGKEIAKVDIVTVVGQVGDREDSAIYIRMKCRMAANIGAKAEHLHYPRSISQEKLIEEIEKLNEDPEVNGIIVQLPLDSENKIDGDLITNIVSPLKDVDGIHDVNAGKLLHGQLKGFFIACTPYGCLELIKRTGVEIKGAKAVVIGRSKIVGSPMAQLLTWNHATVTVCHSRTKDIASIVREADILVVAAGQPQMVKGDWIKPGAVVIDCGTTPIPDSSRASGTRLSGDVDYEAARRVASYITPVPGGVGPMTVIMLIRNTVLAAKQQMVTVFSDCCYLPT
ncbi:MTHFD1 [Cordylochernes scorpioides]|uniref:MTHFD1 n=1 Tax=Cordylochernes scorpioides TaxID=51811 RepID=A0ABY6L770_9ARAC|nr:MTHFD1 [Cordylochernes scorpioides]